MIFRTFTLILAVMLQPFLGWSYTGCRTAAGGSTAAMTCCSADSESGCSGGCGGCGSSTDSGPAVEPQHGCCDPSMPLGSPGIKPCCNPATCVLAQTGPTLTRPEPSKLSLPNLSHTPLPTPIWIAPMPPTIVAASGAWMHARAGPWDGPQQTRRALLCIRTI